MDKGGDEHLVALQRLESALAALDAELSRVDQELSLDQRFFDNKTSALRSEINRSQVYTEQILEMKPYWMAADTDSLNQLAQAAELITQLFAGEEYASPLRGKLARMNVIAKIAALQDHRKLLLRGRYELSAAMVKVILAEDNPVPEPDSNWRVKLPGHELDAVHAGYVRRQGLAEFLQNHAGRITDAAKFLRRMSRFSILLPVILPVLVLNRSLDCSASGSLDKYDTTLNILNLAVIVIGAIWAYRAFDEHRNQMRQMDARANLLSATSSYVFETRERPSQPAMVDIVTFAAQHFDDVEIEPEAFESRTAELKALTASPTPSGHAGVVT